jgi:hypothetical protein
LSQPVTYEGVSVPALDLVAGDRLVALHEVGDHVPSVRQGRWVCTKTVQRWCDRGVGLPTGKRVKLAVWWVGGRRCTTLRAITAFVQAQTEAMASAEGERARRERVEELRGRLGTVKQAEIPTDPAAFLPQGSYPC